MTLSIRLRRLAAATCLLAATFCSGCTRDMQGWLAALEDPDPYVRLMAAHALGEPEVARANPLRAARALTYAMLDPAKTVNQQAMISLSVNRALFTPALVELICSDSDNEIAARQLIGPQNYLLQGLHAGLINPDCGNRWLLARILVATGEPAAQTLLSALKNGDEEARALALTALGDLGPGAREILGELEQFAAGADGELLEKARAAIAKIQG